jgi:glycosyltransferase involved in cell wall biosynthesis
MRNEEKNAKDCINTVLNQKGIKNLEIIVLDDESKDGTLTVLKNFPNIKVIRGQPTPKNWIGKLWACHQLAQQSTGNTLVFIDADVRLEDYAISAAIGKMRNWDFISPYPRQIVIGFIQRVFQPLLQWSWMASVPLVLSQKFSIKTMAVANGQFLIVKRNTYFNSGGHEAIKDEVLDDLMLARKLLKHGYKGGVAEASQVAQCRMYDSTRDLILGYQKSLYKAFGSIIGTTFAIVLLLATGIVPILGTLSGSNLALLSFLLVFAGRFISSVRTGGIPNTALLHPLAITILIILIVYSWYGKFTKTLSWRGREILNG